MKQPINVTITGAAGQIGYALAFRVASGAMLQSADVLWIRTEDIG